MIVPKYFKKFLEIILKFKWILTLIGSIGTILFIYNFVVSYIPNIDISYLPEKDVTHFLLQNLGQIPLQNVKVSYSLLCQDIEVPAKYVDLDLPTLTPIGGIQPFYKQNLDETTINTIENSINNSNYTKTCKKEKLSWYYPNDAFGQNFSFSDFVCDTCTLKINATYTTNEPIIGNIKLIKEFSYKFENILHFNSEISCFYGNKIPSAFKKEMESKLTDSSHPLPELTDNNYSSDYFHCLSIISYDIGPKSFILKRKFISVMDTISGLLISLDLNPN